MKLGMISLGCAKNLIDSELFLGVAKKYDLEITNNLKEANIIVVNTCGFIESAKKEAIDTILEVTENKKDKIIIAMGCLVERYLDDLKNHLDKLNECQIDGIIFQDFGVLQICNEKGYSFEKIYDPETLNTNHLTLSVLKEKGIDGAFLAREIPLKEKQMIGQNCKLKTMVQVHGVEYMAYSKRKLLSNYNNYN